jgi:hypothetical protein
MTEILNARIKSTTLGVEDHGIMTFFVFIEWPGAGCGLGGYALDARENGKPCGGSGHAYQAIRQILETVGVDKWEKLPGTLIRIVHPGLGRGLTKIGHILDDKWFDIEDWMKQEDHP